MRLQLALNVPDLEAAVSYYGKLFDTPPHKLRKGYANFAIDEPALKLVLFENPAADEHLNHLGVEVFEAGEVDKAERRLEQAGILDQVESETKCCHASQNKVWSREHDGLRWEWYRIIDDTTDTPSETFGKTCCTGDQMMDNMGAS